MILRILSYPDISLVIVGDQQWLTTGRVDAQSHCQRRSTVEPIARDHSCKTTTDLRLGKKSLE